MIEPKLKTIIYNWANISHLVLLKLLVTFPLLGKENLDIFMLTYTCIWILHRVYSI